MITEEKIQELVDVRRQMKALNRKLVAYLATTKKAPEAPKFEAGDRVWLRAEVVGVWDDGNIQVEVSDHKHTRCWATFTPPQLRKDENNE